MTEQKLYSDQVKLFNEVTPDKADQLLTEKSGHIVYIGRETCSYSRLFVSKLSEVAQIKNLKVNYINSDNPNYDKEIRQFRSKYYVPTVPGFLYSDQNGLKVKCDSSMSETDIASFVNA